MLRSRTTEALALVLMALTWDNAPRRSICSQVACELAANATIHSRSGNGGHFTVRARLGEGCVRVEVHDQGGPWKQPAPAGDEHGRGLLIVASLARNWGITGDSHTGWTVWFEIDGQGLCETRAVPNGR